MAAQFARSAKRNFSILKQKKYKDLRGRKKFQIRAGDAFFILFFLYTARICAAALCVRIRYEAQIFDVHGMRKRAYRLPAHVHAVKTEFVY